jgi:hypothetical protein
MMIKGKTKIATNAEDSKKKFAEQKGPSGPDPLQAMIARSGLGPPDKMLDLLTAIEKQIKDKADKTAIGKAAKIIEQVEKLAKEVAKKQKELGDASALLAAPAKPVIRLPAIKTTSPADAILAAILVCRLFVMAVQKARKRALAA